ncbi:Six-hairpin glycosidase [Aspergillus pseudoustus]|uniref:Six-hairpin glycosidase n=1 Tax=Aspergillus pseudoustus TaxID=1810923 RepID=A0ABR4JT28_9EURO
MLLPSLSISVLALSAGATATTTTATAQSRAVSAATTLQTWYNSATGIWNTCGWWNGANCMTALASLAAALDNSTSISSDDASSFNATAIGVFQNTFSVATSANPYPERGETSGTYTSANGTAYTEGKDAVVPTAAANASLWLDGSYDDDAWWGLAWIAAYDVTGREDYLDLAEGIFYHLSNAWPSKCGNGGIDSDYTHVYVGAIANELFLALAAQLANRVSSNSSYYLSWAQRQWSWFEDSGLINENHTINDGLMDDCTNNGATVWSYNQGVILGGLVELHRAAAAAGDDSSSSSNSTYLKAAGEIATGAIEALVDDDHVLHDVCEPDDCGAADQTQFKGIFMRNLRALQTVAPNDTYAKVINASADSLWENDRTDANGFGVDWSGPVDSATVNASTQSSAMDALVAAIWE